VPSNALELPLFLDSDRMGFFVDKLAPSLVDGQRDVVKNERRQSYENRPYGNAELELPAALFPKGHPYSWPVIGSMNDLTAASIDDVKAFFTKYYAPNNATMVLVGDLDPKKARATIEKWFADVPERPLVQPPAQAPVVLEAEKRLVFEDDVQLPKLILAWPTAPALAPADATLDLLSSVLTEGKSSRLYKTLVYDKQVAQEVHASQQSAELASTFQIEVLARPGHSLEEILAAVDAELAKVANEGATDVELTRAKNVMETRFLGVLESLSGKAEAMSRYWVVAGNPDWFAEDLARYQAISGDDVGAAAARWLGKGRVVMSIVPKGKQALAVKGARAAATQGGSR
jgi:zinc protease